MTEQPEAMDTAARSDTALDEIALGTPIVSFDRGLRKRIIVGACGAALIGVGICSALFFHDGRLGRLVVVGMIVLFLAYFFIGRLRLYICPGGVIARFGNGRAQVCSWEEVSEIACETTDAFFKAGSRSCSLVKRDGSSINVTDLSLAQYDFFLDALRRMSAPFGIPWNEKIIKRPRSEVRFLIFVSCLIGFSVVILIVAAVMLH
jgi:hypothetical protein